MTTTKIPAQSLRMGDKIMPPAREVQLWMRRTLEERNLPESALHMTVTEIIEGTSDKCGRWLVVSADQSPEWNEGRKALPFRFKVRPQTPWQRIG
jgi:hypothetical protein